LYTILLASKEEISKIILSSESIALLAS